MKEKKKKPHKQPDTMNAIVLQTLKRFDKKPVSFKELLKICRSKEFGFDDFVKSIDELKAKGKIVETNLGITLVDMKSLTKCRVVKLSKTFGFVRNVETDEDYFVAGRLLKGAMPEDIVMVKTFKGQGESLEAEVISIVEENFSRFTGEIVDEFGKMKIIPDTLSKYALDFVNPLGVDVKVGDKVMAKIIKRGEKHSQHKCELVASFGSSLKASSCAMSVLEVNSLTPIFPDPVIMEAKTVSDYRKITAETPNRLDLRSKPIFTIDGADTKDIDDAISIERNGDGYTLGVHIADVSHYVTPKSQLDNEAFRRGTSVYYANRVIPMLPKELSNGICSLNPQEDRLAFSCLAQLDKKGKIKSYKFAKTVICSRVKGVYSEINEMLSGIFSDENKEKYAEVIDTLPLMTELADILYKNKKQRGAPELETAESKLIISDEDICVDVVARTRGRSEEMIEDFMLVANECAARFGTENELPFVYRIHAEPTDEKIENFKEGLTTLGIPFNFNGKLTPQDMSDVLAKVKGTTSALIVNNLVLRSMTKAQYSVEAIGHFGLCLADYAHFTSPIRRYPDLSIHRIMSDFLDGLTAEECRTKYNKFVYASAEQSTNTEITAMTVERDCEDCYKAEYMKNKIGEEFEGVICSVLDFGMFVTLPNTCEGLCHRENMPEGEYVCDGTSTLKNMTSGATYKVGSPIKIKVVNADVNSGKVDFALV